MGEFALLWLVGKCHGPAQLSIIFSALAHVRTQGLPRRSPILVLLPPVLMGFGARKATHYVELRQGWLISSGARLWYFWCGTWIKAHGANRSTPPFPYRFPIFGSQDHITWSYLKGLPRRIRVTLSPIGDRAFIGFDTNCHNPTQCCNSV